MAHRPCYRCHRRYIGAAQHMYVTVIDEAEELQWKGPLCRTCFDAAIDWLATHTVMVPQDGVEYDDAADPKTCTFCGAHVDGHSVVFVTDYAAKSDRRDWYGPLCPSCRAEAKERLLVQVQDGL